MQQQAAGDKSLKAVAAGTGWWPIAVTAYFPNQQMLLFGITLWSYRLAANRQQCKRLQEKAEGIVQQHPQPQRAGEWQRQLQLRPM